MIRCRWFGHKLDYVVRFAGGTAADYTQCSRCGEQFTIDQAPADVDGRDHA